MKVVIAIDSFKGSLSSMEAGSAAKAGILKSHPEAKVIVKPLADGGEGTTDALIEGMNGKKISLTVTGPLGQPVDCYYGYIPSSQTAIIEMASAAGITLLPDNIKAPLRATTFGVGEMILHAINLGCRDFIIGIGGSATNDGGVGMLKALGFCFHDSNGNDAGEGGEALEKIVSIDCSNVHPQIRNCHFRVACDVTNPLCGENGATYIYGPQKGVTRDLQPILDQAMAHYAETTSRYLHNQHADTPGAGAAGGMGFAFLSYLNAELTPGIDLILNAVQFEEALKNTDVVVTGEGRLDAQTAMGKAPIGVARLAKKHHAKVIAFAGSVTREASLCNEAGIDAFFPVVRGVTTLKEAMVYENAYANLRDTAEQVFRLL